MFQFGPCAQAYGKSGVLFCLRLAVVTGGSSARSEHFMVNYSWRDRRSESSSLPLSPARADPDKGLDSDSVLSDIWSVGRRVSAPLRGAARNSPSTGTRDFPTFAPEAFLLFCLFAFLPFASVPVSVPVSVSVQLGLAGQSPRRDSQALCLTSSGLSCVFVSCSHPGLCVIALTPRQFSGFICDGETSNAGDTATRRT